jgi:hypothetical protein
MSACILFAYVTHNCMKKQICKLVFRIKQQPDVTLYGLEASLNPEGPATGRPDQAFSWVSSVIEQMLGWYPDATLHCMLHMKPSQR